MPMQRPETRSRLRLATVAFTLINLVLGARQAQAAWDYSTCRDPQMGYQFACCPYCYFWSCGC